MKPKIFIVITDKPSLNYFLFLKKSNLFDINFIFINPNIFLKYYSILGEEKIIYLGFLKINFYKIFPILALFDKLIIKILSRSSIENILIKKTINLLNSYNNANLKIFLSLKGSKFWEKFCNQINIKTPAKVFMFQSNLISYSIKSNRFKVSNFFLYKNYKKNFKLNISRKIKKIISGNPSINILKIKNQNTRNIIIFLQPYKLKILLKLLKLINQTKVKFPMLNIKIYIHHSMNKNDLPLKIFRNYKFIFDNIQKHLRKSACLLSVASTGTIEPNFINIPKLYLNFLHDDNRIKSNNIKIFSPFGHVLDSEKNYFNIIKKLILSPNKYNKSIKSIDSEIGPIGKKSSKIIFNNLN